MRGKSYFEFHKNGLHDLGIPLSWSRLSRGFGMAVWNGTVASWAAVKSLARIGGAKQWLHKKPSVAVRPLVMDLTGHHLPQPGIARNPLPCFEESRGFHRARWLEWEV